MKLDVFRKVVDLDALTRAADEHRAAGRAIVHCHGCFDIVHPGHVRYLQFARQQGDVLVVSLTGDDAIEKSDGTRPYIPQELRAENLAALEPVDHVVIVDGPTAEPVLAALRPDVYVKGKEYEHSDHPGFLAERAMVESAGGRVVFSSGDVVFSSTKLITEQTDAIAGQWHEADRLGACCARWGVSGESLKQLIGEKFAPLRVAVIGDSIADRYVECEQADVASEAPILSVRPVRQTSYLGGAAVVAAHLRAMGAEAHLVSTVAEDGPTAELIDTLSNMSVHQHLFTVHRSLPTKVRYLAGEQKLLKVNHGETAPVDTATERRMLNVLDDLRDRLDAVIFTDFGYGTLSIPFVAQAVPLLRDHVGTIVGDVSGARRTLLAMNDADLLCPTERELRAVVGDFDESLPAVAIRVMRQLNVPNMIVTMDRRGCVMFRPRSEQRDQWFAHRLRSEYLPTLAERPADLVGAGDALLAGATLAHASGASLAMAGYVGSLAAAVAVSRIGNLPVGRADLLRRADSRPELHPATSAAG